ncbi:MAG: P-loop NTPase [Deltaproteobacteria bacterium]|nr:P-loop NTPase [Deltaproteobacteria bacterium]
MNTLRYDNKIMRMDHFHGMICAIGGGKGGVGKSLVSINTACALALEGYEVVLVDADLAGANVHTLFGIKHPPLTLNEFVGKTVGTIEDLLVPTALKNLHLICGATDFIDLANPGHARKQRILRAIGKLPADYILVDIGAGATFNNLDFFNMADFGILVTTPEPTAILSGYEFLKLAVRRKLLSAFSGAPSIKEPLSGLLSGNGAGKVRKIHEVVESMREIDGDAAEKVRALVGEMNLRLVVNNAVGSEGEKVHRALAGIAMQYLQVELPFLGNIPRTAEIERSVRAMTPIVISGPAAAAAPYVEIARRIVSESPREEAGTSLSDRPPVPVKPPGRADARPTGVSSSQVCLNEVIVRGGRTLHVQTEDLGPEKSLVQTLVFLEGRVVFSRENGYADLGVTGASHEAVCEKVRWQHKGILTGIREGRIDREIARTG